MVNFIRNILTKNKARTDRRASAASGRFHSEADKRVKVKEGTEWAIRKYGKTFEILRDYDRS